MPELPQIEPQGVDLSKPIVQSQPSHIGTDIAAQLDKVEDQAVEMGKQAQRMNRYINFHMADAEYISKSANVFDATDRIIDPNTQFATRQRVLGQLKDEIAAKYPEAGPELGPQLDVRASEDVRRAKLEAHSLSVQNAKDNLDALEKPSIAAATNAPTQADADTQIKGFHDSVIAMRDSGLISMGDANKRIAKYDYNLNFAQITKLGMENPTVVQAMHSGDPGVNITPQDLSLIQSRITVLQQRQLSSAHRDFESVINKNDEDIYTGRNRDVNDINQKVINGEASREAGRFGTHMEPRNYAVSGALLKYVNSAPDMTPNEWAHWKANNVDNNGKLESGDRTALDGAIAARSRDAETKVGAIKKTYMAQIKRLLKDKYPGAFGSKASDEDRDDYARDEELAVAQLDAAAAGDEKTGGFEKMRQVRDQLMKEASQGIDLKPVLTDEQRAKKVRDMLDKIK